MSAPAMQRGSPIRALVKALREDPGYWQSWIANIAMAFYDEYRRNPGDVHTVANKAAENFLEQLCRPTGVAEPIDSIPLSEASIELLSEQLTLKKTEAMSARLFRLEAIREEMGELRAHRIALDKELATLQIGVAECPRSHQHRLSARCIVCGYEE